jgi:hypothetical protein
LPASAAVDRLGRVVSNADQELAPMNRYRRTNGIAVAAAIGLALAWIAPAVAADEPTMEALWVDLEKGDIEATRALLKMSARPAETVPFLAKRLKPLRIDEEQVKSLLAMLESDDETVWKPAFEHLEYFDPRLAIDLEVLMRENIKAPSRQRMVEVLSGRPAGSLKTDEVNLRGVGGDGFNFFSPKTGSWWAEHKISRINSSAWANAKKKWTRADRAIVLLEHIGTPEAVAILKDMATGEPEAQPTKTAKESLDRLAGIVKGTQPKSD